MNLCLGTAQFGSDYGVQGNGRPDFQQVCEILDAAVREGIGYLDTASTYGDAESVLGRYFRSHPAEAARARVISKLNPSAFREDERAQWGEIAAREAQRSLSALGIRRFHAYLFHNASSVFCPDMVAALRETERRGFAERIGASVYTPEEALQAISYPEIRAVQVPYNVFDWRLDKAGFFAKAKEREVQVFARSSMLQGLIAMNPGTLPEHMRFAYPYLKRFSEISRHYGLSPLAAAIGYVAANPDIDAVVFGVDNKEQLSQYLSTQTVYLTENVRREFQNAFADTPEKLINPTLWTKTEKST